jgi:hypothetical protein
MFGVTLYQELVSRLHLCADALQNLTPFYFFTQVNDMLGELPAGVLQLNF